MPRIVLALIVLLALAGPAVAVDGVIEINQAKALAGSVTPGDTPGFPVTISASGSYRLTGNLNVSNSHGIEALAQNVSIDLNGFEIAGPITCTGFGSSLSCGAGSGVGVFYALIESGGSVRRGTIRNFASTCVYLESGEALDLTVNSCGGAGLVAFGRAIRIRERNAVSAGMQALIIENSSASGNRGVGSSVLDGTVANSDASSNESHGIESLRSAAIRDSVAHDNDGDGIRASAGSVIRDNVVSHNDGRGIVAGNGSTLSNNTVHQNGGRGVEVGTGGTVTGNSVWGNSGGPGIIADNGSTLATTPCIRTADAGSPSA